jgi:hypothetical protein
LKVKGKITKKIKTSDDCDCQIQTSNNFCGECGAKLVEKEIEVDGWETIEQFVREYQDDEAGYLLELDGGTRESGSGYGLKDELKEFSKKYPDLTYILSCQWESGLVEEGDPGTSYYFVKDGKMKEAKSKVIYVDPFTNEEFSKI